MKLTITLNLLRDAGACQNGYRKLLKSLPPDFGHDDPINLLHILGSNGLDDTLWCLRATIEDAHSVAILIAADIAESVLHIWQDQYPDDQRPQLAIQAARDFVAGKISSSAASDAASDASDAEKVKQNEKNTAIIRSHLGDS